MAHRHKKEFLDILKGTHTFRIRENLPLGSCFIISNERTACLRSYVHINNNHWAAWDASTISYFTTAQLELYLTKMAREQSEITIIDAFQCLEWLDSE